MWSKIQFIQKLKKIYIPSSIKDLNLVDSINDTKQIGWHDDNKQDTGLINQDRPDIDKFRLCNWTDVVSKSLFLKDQDNQEKWGLQHSNFNIDNVEICNINTPIHDMKTKIVFQKDDDNNFLYENSNDIDFSMIDEIKSLKPYKGIPISLLKAHKDENGSYTHLRYLSNPNDNNSINTSQEFSTWNGTYSLSNLVAVDVDSYKNKKINFSINKDFLNKSKSFYLENESIKTDFVNKVKQLNVSSDLQMDNETIDLVQKYIDLGFIWSDNIDYFFDYFKNKWDYLKQINSMEMFLKNYPSEQSKEHLNKYGFANNENPWPIINDLKDKLSLTIEYEIYNPNNNQWELKEITNKLENFIDNKISMPIAYNDNLYKFKIQRISTNLYKSADLIIYPSDSRDFVLSDNFIKNEDGSLTFKKPTITGVSFKDEDEIFNSKFYPSEISDHEFFKKYLEFTDSYNETNDDYPLDDLDYSMDKDDIKGTIHFAIRINESFYEKTYAYFKKSNTTITDIDASKYRYGLICDDITKIEIENLLVANGFSKNVASKFEFKIVDCDNIKGEMNINVCNVFDQTLQGLKGKIFKINNLSPYYLKKNENIDQKILSKSPSKISLYEFKKYFIKESEEFRNRNSESINFNLQAKNKDKKLIAIISYVDNTTNKNVDLKYEYNFSNTNYSTILLWVSISIIITSTILIIGYQIYKKITNKKVLE